MPDSRPQTRFIFVTGGVVSALGKGIAAVIDRTPGLRHLDSLGRIAHA